MYGPASSDLVNAKMADHHRYAKQVALENAARRSLRAEGRTSRSWLATLPALAAALANRLALVRGRERASAHIPAPATRFEKAV